MSYYYTVIAPDARVIARKVRGSRRNALIVIMRVIINRHPAILFGFDFIVFRVIHLDFLGLVDKKPEIVPEFVLMPDTLRHNMTQLVKCDECECVFIDELIPLFGRIHTEREFFALVLTIRGVFAGWERLAYFFGAEVFD